IGCRFPGSEPRRGAAPPRSCASLIASRLLLIAPLFWVWSNAACRCVLGECGLALFIASVFCGRPTLRSGRLDKFEKMFQRRRQLIREFPFSLKLRWLSSGLLSVGYRAGFRSRPRGVDGGACRIRGIGLAVLAFANIQVEG